MPWYIWCAVAAVTSAVVGAHWDISWHQSIGRDTFWTPAHIAIYLCGVLAGLAFGYLVLATTFRPHSPLRQSAVRILGFRAPLGAFIASWGGLAMLTSAPFDNWWHDAYGLDVKILSPPHVVLFAGVYAVLIGTAVLIGGHVNRVSGRAQQFARRVYFYVSGIMLVGGMILLMEPVNRTHLHSPTPYIAISLLVPIVLGSVGQVTRFRFAATGVALFYTIFLIAAIQILPRFPAEPKLGPVYQHVTQFIPPQFPILLLVPALLLDAYWQRWGKEIGWRTSAISAVLFVVALVASEWPFATFLMSNQARNAFFGTIYLGYGVPPQSYLAQGQFYRPETAPQLWLGLLLASVLATLTFYFGRKRGQWIAQVQR